MASPYDGIPLEEWKEVTHALIATHPLDMEELSEVVLQVWEDIFLSGIGSKPFKIGVDFFPRPQIMAYFLHELVPLELARRHPDVWRRERASDEKDLVYIPNISFSVEIKTSSHASRVFGNRSYAQQTTTDKKEKSGYYLTINFESFYQLRTVQGVRTYVERPNPQITSIAFGWIDHSDWTGQNAPSGQQASLTAEAYAHKLVRIFPV